VDRLQHDLVDESVNGHAPTHAEPFQVGNALLEHPRGSLSHDVDRAHRAWTGDNRRRLDSELPPQSLLEVRDPRDDTWSMDADLDNPLLPCSGENSRHAGTGEPEGLRHLTLGTILQVVQARSLDQHILASWGRHRLPFSYA